MSEEKQLDILRKRISLLNDDDLQYWFQKQSFVPILEQMMPRAELIDYICQNVSKDVERVIGDVNKDIDCQEDDFRGKCREEKKRFFPHFERAKVAAKLFDSIQVGQVYWVSRSTNLFSVTYPIVINQLEIGNRNQDDAKYLGPDLNSTAPELYKLDQVPDIFEKNSKRDLKHFQASSLVAVDGESKYAQRLKEKVNSFPGIEDYLRNSIDENIGNLSRIISPNIHLAFHQGINSYSTTPYGSWVLTSTIGELNMLDGESILKRGQGKKYYIESVYSNAATCLTSLGLITDISHIVFEYSNIYRFTNDWKFIYYPAF
jgi:hypothetical protein